MVCTKCGGKMRGKQMYSTTENETIRQRNCVKCGRIIHTLEFEVEYTDSLRASISEAKRNMNKYYKERNKNA